MLYRVRLAMSMIRTHNFNTSNYHMITITMAPNIINIVGKKNNNGAQIQKEIF